MTMENMNAKNPSMFDVLLEVDYGILVMHTSLRRRQILKKLNSCSPQRKAPFLCVEEHLLFISIYSRNDSP